MSEICRNVSKLDDDNLIIALENKYNITFPKLMIEFFMSNNGGTPYNKWIIANGEEYEIRYFLSFKPNDHNNIYKAAESYQKETKGKIVPIAVDQEDGYYCINVIDGCIYYNDSSDGLYYKLFDRVDDFINSLKK